MGGDGDLHGEMDTLWRREKVLNAELEQPADPAPRLREQGKTPLLWGVDITLPQT